MNKTIFFQGSMFAGSKFAILTIFLLVLLAVSASSVFAFGSGGTGVPSDPFKGPTTGYTYPTPVVTGTGQIFAVLGNVFGFLYYLFFAVAAFMFLYAGFLYLTAADDADKIGKAGKILIYGFVAIIVAVVSVGLAAVLANIVSTGTGGGTGL